MDISKPLVGANLKHIKQLASGHPVFKADFTDGSCVIKAENSDQNKRLRDPIEVMNHIDAHAKSRVLIVNELLGVKNWVTSHGSEVEEKNPGVLVSELARALRPPLPGGIKQQQAVFIVMPLKQNLMDLKEVGLQALGKDDKFNFLTDDDGNPVVKDKSGVRKLAEVLSAAGVLEKLGEIVAVDAFNGAQDRVNFEGTGMKWDDTRLACIQNPGNFFVGDGGGRRTVLGLDVFDPANDFSNFDKFDERGAWYPGRIFRTESAAQRHKLAHDLANDIEIILGPRNRKFSFLKQTRLPKGAAIRILKGFDGGGLKILDYFQKKYANGGMPIAMSQRLQACGWMSKKNFPKL